MSRPAEHCAKIKTEAESMSSPFGNLANGTGSYGLNCDNFYLTNEQSASRRTMSTIASSHDNMDVKFREKGNVMSYDQVDFSLLDSFGEPAPDHQFTFETSPSASGDPQGGHDGSGGQLMYVTDMYHGQGHQQQPANHYSQQYQSQMYGQHASFGDSRPAQGQGGPNQGSIAFYDLCGNGPQLAVGNGGQQQQPTKALMSPLGSSQSSPLSATNNSNLSPSDPFDSGFDSPPVCPTSTSGQYQYQDYHTTSPSHQHQQQANSYYAHMTPSQGQQQQHQQTQYYTLRTALTGSVTSDHGALSSNGGLGGSTKVSPSSSLTPNSGNLTSTLSGDSPSASADVPSFDGLPPGGNHQYYASSQSHDHAAQLHMGHGGHPGQHHHMQFISQSHHQPQQQPTGSANHNYHQMALAHPMAHYSPVQGQAVSTATIPNVPSSQDALVRKMATSKSAKGTPGAGLAGKREKKPGKKRRDPNEPQKPVSAYALFFRDTQATIKSSNPNAAFGEVSKIVASMWDTLDPEAKFNYKKRTEQTKKEYLKALAAYRASLLSTASNTGHSLPSTNNNTLIHLLTK